MHTIKSPPNANENDKIGVERLHENLLSESNGQETLEYYLAPINPRLEIEHPLVKAPQSHCMKNSQSPKNSLIFGTFFY